MRLFLAADLPDELQRAVSRMLGDLPSTMTGWRWSRPGAVHLTLRFLGEVAADLDRDCRGGWERLATAAEPFRLALTDLGCFPPRGSPRVLWIGVEETRPGGILERLALEIELAARDRGFPAERRPFRAHLTLARPGRVGRPSSPPQCDTGPRAEGWVRCLTLMQSHLEPTGARYTALASFPLGGGGETDG